MKLGVSGRQPTFVCVEVPENSETEGNIIKMVSDRLMLGYRQYGPFDAHVAGSRDWLEEALEELTDGLIYSAKLVLEIKERAAVLAGTEGPASQAVPSPAENGREVHPIRSTATDWQGHCRGVQDCGKGTGCCECTSGNGG